MLLGLILLVLLLAWFIVWITCILCGCCFECCKRNEDSCILKGLNCCCCGFTYEKLMTLLRYPD